MPNWSRGISSLVQRLIVVCRNWEVEALPETYAEFKISNFRILNFQKPLIWRERLICDFLVYRDAQLVAGYFVFSFAIKCCVVQLGG